MCTVSWRFEPEQDAYEILFNRDELNSRAPEAPTQLALAPSGLRYLAPGDGRDGGTWIAVNECGIAICLLNDYGSSWRSGAQSRPVSRGEVVIACAGAPTLAHISAKLCVMPLERFRAFHLFAFAPGEPVRRWQWTGTHLRTRLMKDSLPVWSSSSFATERVVTARLCAYAASTEHPHHPRSDELWRFHRKHDPAAGASSVLMRRPDACTRSISRIRTGRTRIEFSHARVDWPDVESAGPVLIPSVRSISRLEREYSAIAGCLTRVIRS